MRLYEKRALGNLAIFAGALLIILYLNHGSGSQHVSRGLGWDHVRYQSSSSAPSSQGVCSMTADTLPALVVAWSPGDGDIAWLERLRTKYHLCVYTTATDNTSAAHLPLPANRGHESMAYLTFIIDNYDSIPEAGAVFVHGSRFSWHNDQPTYDNAAVLEQLNVSSALRDLGYHNLRCDWSASTCSPSYGPPQASFETRMNAKLQPWDSRSVSDAALSHALSSLFGGRGDTGAALGREDRVQSQCCAQFVVSREHIHDHTREEYVAIRQWLLDGSKDRPNRPKNAAPADDKVAGRILSYIWHILFLSTGRDGKHDLSRLNDLACPSAAECYCRLFGICDFQTCTGPDRCEGRYVLPPGLTLPGDWTSTHL
ncbi:Protein of unknown function (DUF3431) [Teratosphaeria destructans]|uniref:Uncharacterized protein n=1 Tax=Teratosphaeria destructans TaxID=418781 RepID=A0A9W7W1J3_9PEZI|nr:Protein of unknown function (DUF3431) [Teratosphaeria destructans]